MSNSSTIRDIIKKKAITTFFQPIVDLQAQQVWGWEALTRGPSISPLHSPLALFEAAEQAQCLKALESLCTQNAAVCFSQLQLHGRLFVNLSQEVLIAGSRLREHVRELISANALPPERVVIELTEQTATDNLEDLIEAIRFFHSEGFAIAIDDLGAGYSSLQLWSEVRPDYVKIDRHFVNNIDRDITKQEFVRSILAIAKSVNSKVIAEGVETRGELEVLQNIGIHLFQGYLIARPELSPLPPNLDHLLSKRSRLNQDQQRCAKDIVSSRQTVSIDCPIHDVVKLFQANVSLTSIAVVEQHKVRGMVHRNRFLTEMSRPYAMDLTQFKTIAVQMDRDVLQIDSSFRLEQVSRLVTSRARIHAEEDFVITHNGEFWGIGHVIDLLRQITEIQVNSARHANPLTMLPGNVPIGDCVNTLLQQGSAFTIAYLDLDHFKPFNDHYGYAKGDELLLALREILVQYIHQEDAFIGHIGGDDFIAVLSEASWHETLGAIITEFTARVTSFYHHDDQERGGIEACDRHGEQRFYPFVGLSVGAMRVEAGRFHAFQELSTHLVSLKQKAKSQTTPCVVMERDGQVKIVSVERSPASPTPAAALPIR